MNIRTLLTTLKGLGSLLALHLLPSTVTVQSVAFDSRYAGVFDLRPTKNAEVGGRAIRPYLGFYWLYVSKLQTL